MRPAKFQLVLLCLITITIYVLEKESREKVFTVVLILDGNSEHVAHF